MTSRLQGEKKEQGMSPLLQAQLLRKSQNKQNESFQSGIVNEQRDGYLSSSINSLTQYKKVICTIS
jgi:hypothetical protein